MPDFVYNIGLGRGHEWARRVLDNDPTNAGFTVVAINTSRTDANLKDYDTLAALLADASTVEATNSGYARFDITDSVGGLVVQVDDTSDLVDVDVSDITWSSVAAGTNWTDLVFCYNPNVTSDIDASMIPLTQHDFSLVPDGSNVTAQINTEGFFRAT